MTCDDDYLYTSPWFYLFLLTIILFIIFIIVVENTGNFQTQNTTTSTTNTTVPTTTFIPIWVWVIFILMMIFLFMSFILYYYHLKNYICPINAMDIIPANGGSLIPAPTYHIYNQLPAIPPVYNPCPLTDQCHQECKPCSLPDIPVKEVTCAANINGNVLTIHQYTDADVSIPLSALNPFA